MATLIGLFTLGRDAELRRTTGGDSVASLALAYTYGRKGNDGKKPTQWVEASLWGERAEKLAEHLTKGREFFMSLDDLHVQTFDKRDGGTGFKLAARVNSLEFTRSAPPAQERRAAPPPAPKPPPPASSGFSDMDDDIPF